MGIPPADYEYGGQPAYGDARGSTGSLYAPAVNAQSGMPLPLITG
jgi:hypothetical protein